MVQKIKVLMVDDEPQFRATTARILGRKGYEVTMAASGEEAVAQVEKDSHDVVILDIRMPGIDGHEALKRIKKIRPDVPVIMLTGHGNLESARSSLSGGAFDYLNKPCDIDLLAAKIQAACKVAADQPTARERTAGDIMIRIQDYSTVSLETTVEEAIMILRQSFENLMASNMVMETGHRSLLVFDAAENVVGILSIHDLLQAVRPAYLSAPKPSLADSMQYSSMFWNGLFTNRVKDLAQKKVRDIMSDSPKSITEDTNLMEVADMLCRERVRRLVVTRGKKAVGVLREQELFFELVSILGR